MNNQFAITISKYCRGSLTPQEIQDCKQFFNNKFVITRLLIVNEHKQRDGTPFEHLHVSLHVMGEYRTDNLNALIKKNLSFLTHKKDVLVKKEISDGWKEYCSKSNDRTIIDHFGITEEEIEQYNLDYKIKVQTVKDTKVAISKCRISRQDTPYVIANYIHEHDISYSFQLSHFIYIISCMLKEGYDFELRNMPEVKSKLDNSLGNFETLQNYITDQFKFLS
jgi:hypothetical protein